MGGDGRGGVGVTLRVSIRKLVRSGREWVYCLENPKGVGVEKSSVWNEVFLLRCGWCP